MKKFLGVAAGIVLFASVVHAEEALSPKAVKAKELVEKAAEFYKANGLEKTIAAVNDTKGQFVDGEFYIFIHRFDGINIARGDGNLKRLGSNVLETPDPSGKFYVKDMIKIVQKDGAGWVEYGFKHPTTGALAKKNSYVKKLGDDMVMGCGFFTEQ